MISKFLDQEITYTGGELSSHWAFRRFDLMGDSIVAFVGPCDVPIHRMADLEDVKADAPIRSKKMLHLIVEHFGCDLERAVLRQRLLVSILSEILNRETRKQEIRRSGDDLYKGDAKLSVSIAVKTPVSSMIHLGLNVMTEGTPVRTVGLADLGIAPEPLARAAMERYVKEMKEIAEAQCKVRGVP